ncbi:MAG TPA: cytochrome c [Bryobacterales bacterium]|nr:cytochrome c [Bryobacterales bacterium]
MQGTRRRGPLPPRLRTDLRAVLPIAGFWFVSLLAGCGKHPIHARLPDAGPGRTQFESYCAACHLSGGAGMIGEAPPLEGSSWVAGPENRLIKIVLHGLHGAIEVRSKTYNQEMPAFGQTLTDAEIASLLSFVRQRFGGVTAPVSPEAVSRVRDATRDRTGYWTVDELLKGP